MSFYEIYEDPSTSAEREADKERYLRWERIYRQRALAAETNLPDLARQFRQQADWYAEQAARA